MNRLITSADLQRMGFARTRVYEILRSPDIRTIRIGRRLYLDRDELNRWLNAHAMRQPDIDETATDPQTCQAEHPEWVSVGDGLPEKTDVYLTVMTGWNVELVKYDANKGVWEKDGPFIRWWMPIPRLPEGK